MIRPEVGQVHVRPYSGEQIRYEGAVSKPIPWHQFRTRKDSKSEWGPVRETTDWWSYVDNTTLVTPALPEVGERWKKNDETKLEVLVTDIDEENVVCLLNNGRSISFSHSQWPIWFANATRIGDAKMTKQLNVYDITTNKREAGLTDSFSVVAENFAHAATLADIHKKVGHSIERIDAHRSCRGAIPSPVTSVQVSEAVTA